MLLNSLTNSSQFSSMTSMFEGPETFWQLKLKIQMKRDKVHIETSTAE